MARLVSSQLPRPIRSGDLLVLAQGPVMAWEQRQQEQEQEQESVVDLAVLDWTEE